MGFFSLAVLVVVTALFAVVTHYLGLLASLVMIGAILGLVTVVLLLFVSIGIVDTSTFAALTTQILDSLPLLKGQKESDLPPKE